MRLGRMDEDSATESIYINGTKFYEVIAFKQ